MSYLSAILEHKRNEVLDNPPRYTDAELSYLASKLPPVPSLAKSICDPTRNGIIAEFKRRSPSKGSIHDGISPREVVPGYEKAGVSGISVLTDERFFGGTIDDVAEASTCTTLPILRKEFILFEHQILEARAFGAAAVLIIAAALPLERARALIAYANELGLEVLLELHTPDEAQYVCDGVAVVGVNNRNLKTFEVDLENSIRMLDILPSDLPKIAESGISDPKDMLRLRQAGFSGFLIGEQFMKHSDPSQACIDFCQQLTIQ